jgi:hypothetical protein
MKILQSPWREQFESFLATVEHRLRVAVPYYSEETIRTVLHIAPKDVAKRFILALSDHDVKCGSQSIAAINHIAADGLTHSAV